MQRETIKTTKIMAQVSMTVRMDEQLKFREFKKMVAASDRPELTLDEINEEIRLAREEIVAREKATL